jgi:hypothetical protein
MNFKREKCRTKCGTTAFGGGGREQSVLGTYSVTMSNFEAIDKVRESELPKMTVLYD